MNSCISLFTLASILFIYIPGHWCTYLFKCWMPKLLTILRSEKIQIRKHILLFINIIVIKANHLLHMILSTLMYLFIIVFCIACKPTHYVHVYIQFASLFPILFTLNKAKDDNKIVRWLLAVNCTYRQINFHDTNIKLHNLILFSL